MMSDPKPHDSRTFAERVAGKQGWELNPDPGFLDTLLSGLARNRERYGYYLCPCRESEGSREADRDVICPCDYAKPDIAEYGHCFCALFLDPAFRASGRVPSSIPERRPE